MLVAISRERSQSTIPSGRSFRAKSWIRLPAQTPAAAPTIAPAVTRDLAAPLFIFLSVMSLSLLRIGIVLRHCQPDKLNRSWDRDVWTLPGKSQIIATSIPGEHKAMIGHHCALNNKSPQAMKPGGSN